jgi:hypothetical protein
MAKIVQQSRIRSAAQEHILLNVRAALAATSLAWNLRQSIQVHSFAFFGKPGR